MPIATSGAPLVTPDLVGTTQYEGWEGLTNANYPSPPYPGFFNFTDPWPAPIASNISGSAGNAGFDKVAGGGYPGSASIYNFTATGTYAVSNTAALAGLETVVIQLDLGEGNSFFTAAPTLSYNGGAQNLAATFVESGPGPTAFTNPQTGNPDTTTLFGYQWDLSTITGITDYEVAWTTDQHVTTFNLRLDSSDTFSGNAITAVPEPAAAAALGSLVALAFALLRRRRNS